MPQTAPFIFLATPCYGGRVDINFLLSTLTLQAACEARGVGLHVELLPGDDQITRARARLAERFRAHGQATHLLFVDADIGFAPENAFRLLDAAKDVAGGVYPLKRIEWDKTRAAAKAGATDLMASSLGYVVSFIPTPNNSVEVDEGLARVAHIGTGFMMIRREALERVVAAHPGLRANLDEVEPGMTSAAMVFDTMIDPQTRQHLSEDYAFCRRWADLGGEIWADVESRLTHIGHAAYQGSLMEAMRRT